MARINSQILENEVSACLQLVRLIDAGCRDRSWNDVLRRCDEARTILSKVGDHPSLGAKEKASLVTATEHLGKLMANVQKFKTTGPEKVVSSQKFNELHQIITALGQIQGRLEFQTFEL